MTPSPCDMCQRPASFPILTCDEKHALNVCERCAWTPSVTDMQLVWIELHDRNCDSPVYRRDNRHE